MPVIRLSLDPESAHRFSVKVLGSGLAPKDCGEDDKALEVEVRTLAWMNSTTPH
jgi:dihydroorotate dehydrogenase